MNIEEPKNPYTNKPLDNYIIRQILRIHSNLIRTKKLRYPIDKLLQNTVPKGSFESAMIASIFNKLIDRLNSFKNLTSSLIFKCLFRTSEPECFLSESKMELFLL